MFAEFSYDLVPGPFPLDEVLVKMLEKFDLLPSGQERRRCHLLSDTFICEIANLNDFEATNNRLSKLRSELGEQFNYTFSLRSRNSPLKVKGTHNTALAKQIVEA